MMNDSLDFSTEYLQNLVAQCDDPKVFKAEILSVLQSDRDEWTNKINTIVCENGYTKEEFARLCQVSRTAVSKWCNGSLPSSRDDFIRIGFAAHYTLVEMNAFLQRYGKFPALYPRSLEDSVYIFILNSADYPRTFEFCCQTITSIKDVMDEAEQGKKPILDTGELKKQLLDIKSLENLKAFIEEHAVEYQNAYKKFYAYVKAFLIANNINYADGKAYNVHSLANSQGWTSSLRQCVSAIRQNKWFPLRRKVIALGLHLNMTVEQINEMLSYAQMETLCAKNPVESAIIFAVEDADLNDMICCDGGTELCDHVRMILKELGIPDAARLLNDL